MKLRIKGNSLRMRVTRTELEKLASEGRIEETIWFGPDAGSRQTYALEHSTGVSRATLRFDPPEIAVVLPTDEANEWRGSDRVGIYATVPLGTRGALELLIEKDFVCLDPSEPSDPDAFPNPKANGA